MPLYFFDYATAEAEYVYELKDYLLETQGSSPHLTIIAEATADDMEDLEIEVNTTSMIR